MLLTATDTKEKLCSSRVRNCVLLGSETISGESRQNSYRKMQEC